MILCPYLLCEITFSVARRLCELRITMSIIDVAQLVYRLSLA